MKTVFVMGSFDNLRSRQVRFLDEASRFGEVYVLLWSDNLTQALLGAKPRFPLEERRYLLESLRYVRQVIVIDQCLNADTLPAVTGPKPDIWAVDQAYDSPAKQRFCANEGIAYRVIRSGQMAGFPIRPDETQEAAGRRKQVVVTGCYDWLHSGHIRFFEEVSQLGDLTVVIGHDENVRLLKGEGHPLFGQEERRYMVAAIRFVKTALVSSGQGWMDAEPEIDRLKPDIYAVNEDGDKPEKRAFCAERGLEYAVLKRQPKEGLPRRESTKLRGF